MSDIRELIRALELNKGLDRALAREVQCVLGGWHRITPSQCGRKRGGYISPDDWIGRLDSGAPILDQLHGTTIHDDVPDVTSSVDAAFALAERVVPSWAISLSKNVRCGYWICYGSRQGYSTFDYVTSTHRIPAVALTVLIVKAAEMESNLVRAEG